MSKRKWRAMVGARAQLLWKGNNRHAIGTIVEIWKTPVGKLMYAVKLDKENMTANASRRYIREPKGV